MSRLLLALLTLGLVQNANANHADARTVLDLKNAGIAGTGCRPGEADLRISGNILQLRTPKLSNSTTETAGLSRKACTIAIPFKLKKNERLIVSAGRLNVALNLRRNASARTSAELFTTSSNSARAEASDSGPKNQLSLLKFGGISTACGEDGLLRMNISQILQAKNVRSQARVNGAVLRLQIAHCN